MQEMLRYAKYNARAELVAEFTRTRLVNEETIKRLVDGGIGGFIRDALGRINRFIRSMRLNGKELTQADYLTQAENALRKAINERRRLGNEKNGEAQYLITEIVDDQGNNYGTGVYLNSVALDGLATLKEIKTAIKGHIKNLGGIPFTVYDKTGLPVTIKIAEPNRRFTNQKGQNPRVIKDLTEKHIDKSVKQQSVILIDELIDTAQYAGSEPPKPGEYHAWLDNYGANDWEYWTTYVQDKNNAVWEVRLNVATTADGEKILYDLDPIIEKTGQAVTKATSTVNNSIQDDSETVNHQNEKDSEAQNLIGGEITDADILQMLVDEGVLQTMEPGIEPALSAIGALADKTPGTNTDPNDVRSGQRIISDMMGAMGLTADARHARYDLHLRKGTAGYTMQDRIAHIQDAQNVITAAHELGSFI